MTRFERHEYPERPLTFKKKTGGCSTALYYTPYNLQRYKIKLHRLVILKSGSRKIYYIKTLKFTIVLLLYNINLFIKNLSLSN